MLGLIRPYVILWALRGGKRRNDICTSALPEGYLAAVLRLERIAVISNPQMFCGHPLRCEGSGHYHGYPMPEADPFREEILSQWESS